MPRVSSASCLFPAIAVVVAGCATAPQVRQPPRVLLAPRGVVFVADGAGGGDGTTRSFRRALEEEGVPLSVEGFNWSHGFGRYISDERDSSHARERGRELADRVASYRAHAPNGEVYLVAHSAGSAVVLNAAEALPPNSINRIVLLSPSVSADRDLRPALRCARDGVDVFCSRMDWFYLGFGTSVFGTSDGPWRAAAGRIGFRTKVEEPADATLYTRLRQHPWDPAVEWTGNHGGHYGGHESSFLHAYVVPLFTTRSPIPANGPNGRINVPSY
jgi:pimeloyl-ACP methyl ester carboxylesterase